MRASPTYTTGRERRTRIALPIASPTSSETSSAIAIRRRILATP
ncbi:MAG TPA: hypothetical protein VKH41_03665 [Myxococcota bacterium]|nr:hypothetical protein [Myxococcota bacterium]